MAGAQKKVIVRLRSGDFLAGYLPPRDFVTSAQVELFSTDGLLKPIGCKDIQLIAFVTDFNLSATSEPENLGRRTFLARPRGSGLWLRVTFSDGTTLEGLGASDLRFAQELATDQGIFLTPPDPRSNSHRVYIPRQAMAALEFLAVIGAGAHPKPKPAVRDRSQPGLFEGG